MQFTNIINNDQKTYVIDRSGAQVFFLFNQSGNFSFELNAPGAEAHIFALFTGEESDAFAIKIDQIHNAPKTTSHVIVKYLGKDQASMRYEGLIRIGKDATGCIASQKNTNLLLSDDSSAFSFPSLEILTDDVICHHGSTTSRVNKDHLFYAESRGVSKIEAEKMLADGFVNDFFLEMDKLGQFDELKKYRSAL